MKGGGAVLGETRAQWTQMDRWKYGDEGKVEEV